MTSDFAVWFPYCNDHDVWIDPIKENETKESLVKNVLAIKEMSRTRMAIVARVSEASIDGHEHDFCCYLKRTGDWAVRRIRGTLLPIGFIVDAKIKGFDLMTMNCEGGHSSVASAAAWATKAVLKQVCDQESRPSMKSLENDFSYIKIIQGEKQYTFHFPAMLFDSIA